MAKRADEAEVKKECPSCGLGVALDSTVCEFCGWDFEEEDEWILQIEKLERDLMLEKQKFEPGTLNNKIESTLHSPGLEKLEAEKSAKDFGPQVDDKVRVTREPVEAVLASQRISKGMRDAKPEEMMVRKIAELTESLEPEEKKVRRVKEPSHVQETPVVPLGGPPKTKKTRVVRKVKQ